MKKPKKTATDRQPRNRAMLISVILVAIYISGIWMTAGYTARKHQDCTDQISDYLQRWETCGDGFEEFAGSILWPIYWYIRTAKIVWGVK